MKIFSKIISFLLIVSLVLITPVYADNTVKANTLYELGLFRGTDTGYDLDKTLTREQAVTILVRLLGEEENVLGAEFDEKFTDVESTRWSYPYIMYCYENNITKGTGEDTFSPEDEVTAEQFVTLVMRLMGYEDIEPDVALLESVYINMLNTDVVRTLEKQASFLRDDMVYVVYRSLMCNMSDGIRLAEFLAEKGVITKKEAKQFDVYETSDDINDLLNQLLG